MIATAQSDVVLAGGGTVITATQRLARQIRRRHDQSQAAGGARAWPTPDVLPLDAWLRRTWESTTLRDTALGRLRLLSDDESRLVWRRVITSEHPDRMDAGVIVPLVAGGWRLCQRWGISLAELAAAADSDDGRAFARWADAYVSELNRRAWIDNAGLLNALGRAAPDASIRAEALLGFAGFDPWTPALRLLANALGEAGATVAAIAPRRRAGLRQIVAARTDEDELSRAFRWAAVHARPESGATVAIVLPNLDQDAGHARRIGLELLAPGWQLREPRARPVALAVGRQLGDYPIVHCALTLLRVVASEVPFDEASYLLRSCYVAGADPERAGRARAELKLRRLPLDRVPLRTLLGMLGDDASQAAEQWRRAESLAAAVLGRRLPPSQWAGHFTAWLAAAGWPGDRGLASEEFQAAEAWQRLVESFARADEVAGTMPLRTALGILNQQARDRPFEPESPDGAVQVLNLREAEGQDFDALWICGMTADQWPPPARPHPLVALSLQQAAQIPDASALALEAHTSRRFEELLACADHLVLSWPAERDEAETLPSPLLASPLLATSLLPSPPLAEEEATLHPDRQRIAGSARAETVPEDPPPAWASGQTVPGGARVLAMQAVCPARAFVEFRLRGAALEAPAKPLDLATRGKIVHRLLERLYSVVECSGGLGEIDTAVLRTLFAPVLATVLDEFLPTGERFLESLRPLESERLWSLVLSLRDLDSERSGFQVVTEVARLVTIGPLALSIRLDRLDRLAEGGELVIDYKTGRFEPAGWKRPRLPESQLPLYAVTSRSRGVAVLHVRPPAAQLRGVGDDQLAISGIKTAAAFFREDGLDWTGTLVRWQSQLERLANEFAAGDFRVDPADRQWATGQFAGLTRVHEVLPVADSADSANGTEE